MDAHFGGFQNASAGGLSPATDASSPAGGPIPQGESQICHACGYAIPSNKPCKQCGYVGFPNEPKPQRLVPLQEPELERNANVPVTVTQAAVHQDSPCPSTNVPAPVFQPIHHSSHIAKARLPAQEEGRGLEMSQVSCIGVPRENSEPPEQCLRCCFLREFQTPGHQPYAKGEQGGLQPPTRNALQGLQQMPQPNVQNAAPAPPQSMGSDDRCRRQPETCHRCRSAKVPHPTVEPDRAVATNVPPIAPTPNGLFDSPESMTLGGNAGGEGGGHPIFGFVVDDKSGNEKRWNLLLEAIYNLGIICRKGPPGPNLQCRSSVASAQGPFSYCLPPAPALMQGARQPEVPVQLPDPSALSPSDGTGSQLLRQAAILGLSQRRDTSPAVFVRLNPPAGNVALQSALPQASRAFPTPVTTLGKLALEGLQEADSESRQLQQRSSEFLEKYRKHLLRRNILRQAPPLSRTVSGDYYHLRNNQPPEEGVARSPRQPAPTRVRDVQRPAAANENMPQATSHPAATSRRPLSVHEARGSVPVSTQTGPHSGRPASPGPPHDLQVEGPMPAPKRVFMQGSLRSILPDSKEMSKSQGQRDEE